MDLNENDEFEFRLRAEQEGPNTDNPPFDPRNEAMTNGKADPGLQDVSVPDAMAVQGVAGLAKGAVGLGARALARGVGEVLPENLVRSMGETANSQLLKSIGTSPMQIKGLMAGKSIPEGVQAVEDAANVGRKAGLDEIFSTGPGRREALTNYIEKEGKRIGDLRQEAGPASPGLLDRVSEGLKSKYNPTNPDVFSSEASDLPLARNTISNIAGESPTNAKISEGITGLNKYAAGNRANLPKNALTDFAGKASAENDAEIAQGLGPDKAAEYLDALKNESGAFHLKPAMARGFQRETASRGGKGVIQSGIQKLADLGGNRAASQGLNAVHGALTGDINAPEALAGMVKPAAKTIGGITSNIMSRIQSNPQSLGRYAAPLMQAAQSGGSQGVAATHYMLSLQHPDYNEMMQLTPDEKAQNSSQD